MTGKRDGMLSLSCFALCSFFLVCFLAVVSLVAEANIFRVAPFHFLHVLDQNTNVTRVELGPQTFYRQDNEAVVYGPERMVCRLCCPKVV